MNELQMKAVLAGIFFGAWPFFMNKSGLGGNISPVALSAINFLVVLPFAFYGNKFSISSVNWTMVVLAGILSSIGLIFFNGMIASTTKQNIGALVATTTIIQIVVAALYQTAMNGWHMSTNKAGGYVAAAVAAYLLLR